MAFLYHIESGTLCIEKLQHAMRLVVKKHKALRTSLFFDFGKQQLMQRINEEDCDQLFSFVESKFESMDEVLTGIMHTERGNPSLFDLERGVVCRLHVVRRNTNDKQLLPGDNIIFNFHHAMFDFPSVLIFHHDFNKAYTTSHLDYDDENQLRYVDCKS